jgi:hypothetical protein
MSLSQQTHWRNISGPQTRTSRSNSQKGHWFGTTIYSFKNRTQIRGRSGTQAKPTQICSSMIISILLHNFLHCQVYSITPISYILFSPKRNSLCRSTDWYSTTQCNARTEIEHTSPTLDQIQELGEEEATWGGQCCCWGWAASQQELKLTIHRQPWIKFRNWERRRLSNDVTGMVSWFHDVIWTMDCY